MDQNTTTSPTQVDASDTLRQLTLAVDDIMNVEAVRRPLPGKPSMFAGLEGDATLEIRGCLRLPSEQAYDLASERFRALNHIALFRRSPYGDLILAVPGSLVTTSGRPWLAIGLFLVTLISVLAVGAMSEQQIGQDFDLLAGLPFALSLLGILVAHEMGHYLVARRYGIPASLPYFIPLPLSILGTMGAVMQIKAPPRNRRQLLALGAAGPLAGLVVALPVLWLGLSMSEVQVMPTGVEYFQEGNSLLYAGMKMLIFGRFLPGGGEDVFLHPVALAGWAGLLVTALNLIPAGQLDGGHVLYTLLGERAKKVVWAIIFVLLGLSLLWYGWLLWVALVYIFGKASAVPLDDITPPRLPDRLLAVFMLVLALLVFVPIPMNIA